MLRNIFTALLLMASAATAETITLTAKDLGGGGVTRHYNRVQELNRRGVSVVIDAPVIESSGTFYLMVDSVCVKRPSTLVNFHGPQAGIGAALFAVVPVPVNSSFMPKQKADYVRAEMAAFYNSRYPGLGDWFMERAAHKAGFYVTGVRASELNRVFGVPICEG